MLGIQIIYIGDDANFDKILANVGGHFQIPYRRVVADKAADLEIRGPAIVFAEFGTALAGLPRLERPEELIIAVAVITDAQAEELARDPNWPDYDDVISRTVCRPLLEKRVELYIGHLAMALDCAAPKAADDGPAALTTDRNLEEQLNHVKRRLAAADEHLRVHTEVLDRIERIRALSRRINCLDLDQIASVCVEEIPRLIGARFASLYAYDSEDEVLHLLRHNHPYTIDRLIVVSEHKSSPMVSSIQSKELQLIRDFQHWKPAPRRKVARLFESNYRTNSCIIAPIMSGESVIGVLNLADKLGAACFDQARDLPPVQLLCEIIGSAMTNIKLYEEVRRRARTDGATGLLNQKAFYSELDREVSRLRRYGGSLSLIMADLDGLKAVNDLYGHRAGDRAIEHVAAQIKQCLRESDVAARYGGDEFAAILPNTSLSDAACVARRLVKLVRNRPVECDGRRLDISVSIGLSQYKDGVSLEELINQTDAAMFDAKAAGKNQVHIHEPARAAT